MPTKKQKVLSKQKYRITDEQTSEPISDENTHSEMHRSNCCERLQPDFAQK